MEQYKRFPMIPADLDDGYRLMAQDEVREAEALEWVEALIGDALSSSVAAADENG